ncbi:hypothetical protein AA106555_1859 [Neokomagataea thailandica NBRC 106555]|uniref:Uncharacterized protein n=3 Tax=Acetobacteraceae TaxID=433 RepID=A0A4Y6V3E0_9PROT|nr:hypothetical protein D5366_04435 [Neokomagataea tanensis]GBR54915.1 hypothetical protein AA106555_1859 [Neokomagataea thailandica NBRC 106555]
MLFGAVSSTIGIANGADTNQNLYYTDSNGQKKPLTVLSSLDISGKPLVSAYKDTNNQWHKVAPSIMVCGVGTDGSPVACPSVADTVAQAIKANAPNGIAALNANAEVTSPISTASVVSSKDLRVVPIMGNNYPNTTGPQAVQLPGYTMWYGNQIGLGRYPDGSQPSGYNTVGDWWTTPPETLHLGGQSEGASGYLNVHCSPYGGSNAGTCSQIMLGTPNIQGQAAGLGPGATGIANYDNFDATNQVLQATNSVPLFVITSNTATNVFPPASDGLDHTPTFTASGATFANPLPADMSNWLVGHQQGIRLMTNEIGCQTCSIQTYAGVVSGVSTNSAGLVTGLKVAAWQVFNSKNTTQGQIPGVSTTDNSKPSLDTTWSNFGAPAIMVGVYTKAFNMYSLCTLDGATPSNGRGDINSPSGGANNQLRTCEGWEMDLWNNDPVNFRPNLHGLTVAFNKLPRAGQPSYDSFDVNAAGANSISYEQSGEYWTLPFSGINFSVSGYEGTPLAAGSVKNVVQWRQSERVGYESDGGWPRNNIMPGIWTVRNVAAGCTGCNDPNGSSKDITTNIGVQVDWYGAQNRGVNGDPLWNGTTQEHIELNPKSSPNGINLCNGAQTDKDCSLRVANSGVTLAQGLSAGATINTTGDLSAQGALRAGGGIHLSSANPVITLDTGAADGNNTAVQFKYDLPSNTIYFTNNHYGNNWRFVGPVTSTWNMTANSFIETLSTPASSSASCTAGQFTDDANYHYVCVAANTWKRVALSSF